MGAKTSKRDVSDNRFDISRAGGMITTVLLKVVKKESSIGLNFLG
jgi:hypothetical protein